MKETRTTTTKLNSNQIALYKDKYGILHGTKDVEKAMQYGGGKYLVTDECTAADGFPVIDGVTVKVYGAGKGYVYLSKESKEKDIRYIVVENTYQVDKSVSIDKKQLKKAEHAAYRKANELYLAF